MDKDVAVRVGVYDSIVVLVFIVICCLNRTVISPEIQQGELELPRNQTCVLVAIPKVTEDN